MRARLFSSLILAFAAILVLGGNSQAQDTEGARKKCVEFGFKENTSSHESCMKQFLQSTGAGKVPSKPSPPAAPPTPLAAQMEEKFWDSTLMAGNREAFQAYIDSYPAGRYTGLAKANMTRLEGAVSAQQQAPADGVRSTMKPGGAISPSVAPMQPEEKFWDGAMAARNESGFQEYLEKYPDGIYAGLARANLVRLRAAVGASQPLEERLRVIEERLHALAQAVDGRLRAVEPVKVASDGREFMADQAEKRDFEAALALFRKAEFSGAKTAFFDFLSRYSRSGYVPSALFWLGNAQYATRDYTAAMLNFRALIANAPDHQRTPEAVLSVANCQLELKDSRGARKTLQDLVSAFPKSEAAVAARERLVLLK